MKCMRFALGLKDRFTRLTTLHSTYAFESAHDEPRSLRDDLLPETN